MTQVMHEDSDRLVLNRFATLKKQELDSVSEAQIELLDRCSQSIYRHLQYCRHHYANLSDAAQPENLAMDRIGTYRRAGDLVDFRYVYEANISAFMSCLHALLDSFPYLLNTFIPVINDSQRKKIAWTNTFIQKYKNMPFHDELAQFFTDENFCKLKGYTNHIKHRNLVRIRNTGERLEFECFDYPDPKKLVDKNRNVDNKDISVKNADALSLIEHLHDDLIPKYLRLCNKLLDFKMIEIGNLKKA